MTANEPRDEKPTMQGPATYQIRVRGRLDSAWSDRLAGMQITHTVGSDENTESVLTGRLADQSALNGVLETLYELHLPVIAADCLERRSD
jgi:hypothetical protein